MIIAVSIVDKHKASKVRPGKLHHVGTYFFEIDYPADSHFDIETFVTPSENEEEARPFLNRLLTLTDMKDPVNAFTGEPI